MNKHYTLLLNNSIELTRTKKYIMNYIYNMVGKEKLEVIDPEGNTYEIKNYCDYNQLLEIN